MNKITMMAVVVMAAMMAHATLSRSELYTTAYGKDTSPSTAKRADYTAYYCTVEAAADMFNGANTRSGIEKYLAANFAEGKDAMETTTEGNFALTTGDYGLGQYSFVAHFAEQIAAGNYFAVAFYGDDAFRVFESADVDSGNLRFDDQSVLTTAGSWQAVPEPTSALLMMLGLAGLALKRKRA